MLSAYLASARIVAKHLKFARRKNIIPAAGGKKRGAGEGEKEEEEEERRREDSERDAQVRE